MRTKITTGIIATALVVGSVLPSFALDWTDTMQERGYEAYSGPTSYSVPSEARNARAQYTRGHVQAPTRVVNPSTFGYGPYPDRPYGDPDLP